MMKKRAGQNRLATKFQIVSLETFSIVVASSQG